MDIKMDISRADVKKFGMDANKFSNLTIGDRFFYRPLGNILLPFLYNQLGLSPNAISLVSMSFAILGYVLIFIDETLIFHGLVMLMTWGVLDCSDGSLARTLRYKYNIKNPLGDLFDASAGYVMISGLWFSLGYHLYRDTMQIEYFIIGALSSNLGLLSRLFYNKMTHISYKNSQEIFGTKFPKSSEKSVRGSLAFRFYENIEIGSFLLIFCVFAVLFNFLYVLLLFYFVLNILLTAWFFVALRKLVLDARS